MEMSKVLNFLICFGSPPKKKKSVENFEINVFVLVLVLDDEVNSFQDSVFWWIMCVFLFFIFLFFM